MSIASNNTIKYVVFVIIAITASFIFLKPIVTHESEYRVVVVNTSERPISSIIISGAGTNSSKIGPIRVGDMQDYYFTPTQDGALSYSIIQNKRELNGIINADLKKEEKGEIYVVIGEMHKIKIYDDYDAAY